MSALRSPARRARLAVLGATALGLALAGALPAPSGAATYTVWSCRGPAGEPVPATAWVGGGSAGSRTDDCAAGGALRARLGAGDSGGDAEAGYRLVLPAGASIASWRVWFVAGVAATDDGSTYAAGVSEADALGVRGATAGCLVAPAGCTAGDPNDPVSDQNLAQGAADAPGLAVFARCATAAGCAPTGDPAAHVELYRSAVDLDDPGAPAVGPLSGTLAGGGPMDGLQSVVVPVADAGGGVATTELLIDGAADQRADSGGGCAVPYTSVAPCPAQTDRAFVVDLSGLAPGPHAVAARVTDAAGNATTGPDLPFVVAPRTAPEAPPAGPAPAVAPAAPGRDLTLALPARVAIPERSRTRGQARWADGSPAAGVRLDVLSGGIGRPVRAMHRITRVTTAADGSFTLPRTTTSRSLRVVPTTAGHPEAAAEVDLVQPLRLALRAPAGTVRNGARATFRGRVTGAGDAAEDLQVLVQAIVRGRWSTVDTVRPDDAGRAVWRYRFTRTLRRSAYRFRFVVDRSRNLPWARTVSPRRIVRVVP